ncbi:MAG: hypothetical protein FJ098_01865 [Deltaproteobacteria bacterium]|nr:hypothetical protein [Deltaproteobacteria bacterium]
MTGTERDVGSIQGLEGPGSARGDDDAAFERLGRAREARLRLGLRASVLAVSVLLAVYFLGIAMPNLDYWVARNAAVTDLGDLRRDDGALDRLRAAPSNAPLRYTRDVPTIDSLKTDKDEFFYFSPLTRCVVRTPRKIPDKGVYMLSAPELGPFESRLVVEKQAHPEDVMVSMDGEGRYLAPPDVPRRFASLVEFFSQQSKVPAEEIGLILDGDLPRNNWPAVPMAALPVVILFITAGIFLSALRTFLRVRRGE